MIHSFWVPNLAGKMDMIPSRQTRLALEPTRTGSFRGQCAEFCGTSRALMAFQTVVMAPDDFEAWLAHDAGPAVPPADAANRSACENEFSTALVAIDVTTGQPAWRFQTVHYDLWDYDLGSQPTLVDFPTDGGTVPAVILASKQGQIYVLDRRTGEPLFCRRGAAGADG